jgi:hypothetical protein
MHFHPSSLRSGLNFVSDHTCRRVGLFTNYNRESENLTRSMSCLVPGDSDSDSSATTTYRYLYLSGSAPTHLLISPSHLSSLTPYTIYNLYAICIPYNISPCHPHAEIPVVHLHPLPLLFAESGLSLLIYHCCIAGLAKTTIQYSTVIPHTHTLSPPLSSTSAYGTSNINKGREAEASSEEGQKV